MSLELSVKRGVSMIEAPSESRDGMWAYNACKLSQEIIEDVIESCPPPDYVEHDILEGFLYRFPALVREVKEKNRGGDFTTYLDGFAANIDSRISTLKNYVVTSSAARTKTIR